MVADDDADSGGCSSQSLWKPPADNMSEAPDEEAAVDISAEDIVLLSTTGPFLC